MCKPDITILIPNYKTPELTRLCLRLLNKFTPAGRAAFIAVDNHSGDDSLEYLKSLPWITLLERDTTGETGPQMHARALDLALKHVTTEFVMVIHTDTLVLRGDWLDFLLKKIRTSDKIAGVGSWKLEHFSPFKRFAKGLESAFRELFTGHANHEERYLRSHCALYRTQIVKDLTNGFDDEDTAGRSLHRILTAKGYDMQFLSSEELGRYLCHLNHATGILHPPEGSRRCAKPEAKRKLTNSMSTEFFREVLNDASLDVRQEIPQ